MAKDIDFKLGYIQVVVELPIDAIIRAIQAAGENHWHDYLSDALVDYLPDKDDLEMEECNA